MRISFEDRLINKNVDEQLGYCKTFDIFNLIRKRGLKISSEEDSKKFMKNDWIPGLNKNFQKDFD